MSYIENTEKEANSKPSIENLLQSYSKISSKYLNYIRIIDSNIELLSKGSKRDEVNKFQNLKRLLEFSMLTVILIYDLQTTREIYQKGQSEYEKLFALKQSIVIINEGYKKIFKFVKENKDGSYNYTQRDNSFWNKDICLIVYRYSDLKPEFDSITNELDEYYASSFEKIKEIRDITVHFDREPERFFNMLNTLNSEEIFNKIKSFGGIIKRMNQLIITTVEMMIKEALT